MLVSVGYSNGIVQVWNAETGEILFNFDDHQNWVHALAWSPDNKLLGSSSSEKTVIRTIPNGNQQSNIPMNIQLLKWTPNSDRLIGRTIDTFSVVWDLMTDNPVSRINAGNEVALSPDGAKLAGVEGNHVSIWSVSTGQMLVSANYGHQAGVSSIAWSPDNQRLATGSGILGSDYTVRIWDSTTGNEELVLEGHQDTVISLLWYPDGVRLVSAGFDGKIYVWDTITGQRIGAFDIEIHDKSKLAISPDGKTVATIDDDGSVSIWDISTQP